MTEETDGFQRSKRENGSLAAFDLLKDLSIAVAQAETTSAAFQEALRLICEFMEWPLGHVYFWSEPAEAFQSSRIWYVRDPESYGVFREFSERTPFGLGEGTVGRAARDRTPLRLLDVRNEETYGRELPVDDGICAYFAFPVIVGDRVEAVLEFCAEKPDEPEKIVDAIILHTSALLGLAMERAGTFDRLRKNEELLAESQRIARLAHWEWDVARDLVVWSPELYRIFDVDPDKEELTYTTTMERVHPDDIALVEEKIASATHRKEPFDYLHRIVRTDGEVRFVHERVRIEQDDAGNIIRYYGTTQDVTEQKEGELRLARSVGQLSALMEIGQTVAATFDLETIYQKVLTLMQQLLDSETIILLLYREGMLEVVADEVKDVRSVAGLRVPIPSGISGEVWTTGQSRLMTGEACRKGFAPVIQRHVDFWPEALIAAPVQGYGEKIGVLAASHRQPDGFDENALKLLETAASWTAIAIENAEQYRSLQRRLGEKDAIAAISTAMAEAIEVSDLLTVIVEQVQLTMPRADWAAVHLLNSNTNLLELAASAGLDLDPAAYLMQRTEGVAGYAVSKGRVVNVADVQTDPRRLPVDRTTNARSLLVAPVESRLHLLGTISVQCATPGAFSREDERLLQILGIQAGIAIENAQLYEAQRRAREKAERQSKRIRQMAYRMVEAQEQERSRIARELHDEAGQVLTSLTISLGMIRAQLPPEMEEVRAQLDSLKEHAHTTIGSLRLLAHNLRPPGLERLGLNASLEGLVFEYQSHTQVDITYNGVEVPDLSDLSALTLYRFAQEALTNAVRHAAASQVTVTLSVNGDSVFLAVEDNGRGFDPPDFLSMSSRHGSGLLGMLERLEMVDGQLAIRSQPGQGARLTAMIPHNREAEDEANE